MSMGDVPRGFRDGRLVWVAPSRARPVKGLFVLYDFRAYER